MYCLFANCIRQPERKLPDVTDHAALKEVTPAFIKEHAIIRATKRAEEAWGKSFTRAKQAKIFPTN